MKRRQTFGSILRLTVLVSALGCASGGEEFPDVTWDVPRDGADAADDGVVPEVPDGVEAQEDGPPVSCTTDPECDDGIDCTVDRCNMATGFCEHDPQALLCDDGNPCNGSEACSPTEGCRPGAPVECDDGIGCTVDACDPLTVECTFTPDHGGCTSPQICDPTRTPDPSGCISPPACAIDGDCNDGDACNGRETCGPDRLCRPGTPVSCTDGRDCTVDRCRPADGGCDHVGPDLDGDTYEDAACTGTDCNDRDRLVNPAATELCNGADDNCDTVADNAAACPPLPNASSVSCVAATCVPTCAAGWGNCNGIAGDGCERALNTTTDCGGCGVACDLSRASESCSTGSCTITSCDGGWGDCNRVASDGCEQSLTTTSHCGGCGVACNPPNATGASCSTGSCTFSGCVAGYGNCNTSTTDGCETNLNTATSCGTSCATVRNCTTLPYVGSAGCSGGTCTISTCASGRAECNDIVTDGCERNLNDNIGTCGNNYMGSIAGDDGSGVLTRTSYGENWYYFTLREDSGSSVYISATITLTVPAGVDYDVFVRCGGSCSTTGPTGSLGAGLTETVNVRWDDRFILDDGRNVYVEIRWFSGSTTGCGEWTMTIRGNTAVSSVTCP